MAWHAARAAWLPLCKYQAWKQEQSSETEKKKKKKKKKSMKAIYRTSDRFRWWMVIARIVRKKRQTHAQHLRRASHGVDDMLRHAGCLTHEK